MDVIGESDTLTSTKAEAETPGASLLEVYDLLLITVGKSVEMG